MQFEQIASAQFQIGTGSETITVEGVPYIWDSTRSGRDEQASLAVATYIGDFNLSKGKPVTLLWVSSKPHNREGYIPGRVADIRDATFALMLKRAESAEAKLAKAQGALHQMVGKRYYADDPWEIASVTLAELKGQADE